MMAPQHQEQQEELIQQQQQQQHPPYHGGSDLRGGGSSSTGGLGHTSSSSISASASASIATPSNGAMPNMMMQQQQSMVAPAPAPLPPLEKLKCVFLGDGAVGKTSLIVSYTTNGYPSEYIPTAIDTYDVVVHVDGEPVTLEMCDTPGQDDFDTLRPLVYPNTDVFLLCFSVVSPSSFANIKEKWLPEIKKAHRARKQKMSPLILVGTQSDLRNDASALVALAEHKEVPVTEAEAKKLSTQLGCECYIESSSLTQRNLKEVFDEAIVAGIKGRRKKEKRAAKRANGGSKGSPGGSSSSSGESTTGCVGSSGNNCVIL